MEIGVQQITVRTKRAFTIARSSSDSFERVILTLEQDGYTGRGEAAPTAYYDQNAEDVAASLQRIEVHDPRDIKGTLGENSFLPPSALAALDASLHDLAAKRRGVPVYRLLGLTLPKPTSAYTLGIADPATTVGEADRLSGFPILKMKVGSHKDLETVRAVSEVSKATLWVDANEAFSPDEAPEAALKLKEMGVAMVEQPVAASAGPEALKAVTEAVRPLPVIADESAIDARDVPKLAGCVSGVNVKLAKCGGLRGALAMVRAARAHDMLTMLGCMVETSLGIAAAAHISGLFDFVDLDGAMLLAEDPFAGPRYENGRIVLPDVPGLGGVAAVRDPPRRRYAILAEGHFMSRHAKTAHGLLAYGRDEVVCVIDSSLAGGRVLDAMPSLRRDAPIVGSLEEALDHGPTSMLVGLAPAGGRLPEEWMEVLREAARGGLEIVSGLHQRLAPELPEANVWDVREPPKDVPLFSGEGLRVEPKVALTVGTNSAIGKMTATLEVELAALKRGIAAEFVATGQSGIIITGWGICVDAVVSDFVAGASEQLVLRAAGAKPDLVLVEGQGSLAHPAYSGVTLGLLHGSCPDCLILCADASQSEIMPGVPRPSPKHVIPLYEEVAALVKPAPVVAVSLNTRGLDDEEAARFVGEVSASTGLPAADPVRGSAETLLDAVLEAPKTRAVGA